MSSLLALVVAFGPVTYFIFRWGADDDAVRRAMIRDNRSDLLSQVPGEAEKRRRMGIGTGLFIGGILVGMVLWRQ